MSNIKQRQTENRLREFIFQLSRLKKYQEKREFLIGILTPKELIDIPKRLEIVRMLSDGISQQRISDILGVGIATVTRGSKEMQKGRFKNLQSWQPPPMGG